MLSNFFDIGSGRSAAWLARLPWEQEVGRSNRLAPTIFFEVGKSHPDGLWRERSGPLHNLHSCSLQESSVIDVFYLDRLLNAGVTMGDVNGPPSHIEGIGLSRLIAFNDNGSPPEDVGMNSNDLSLYLVGSYLIGPGNCWGEESAPHANPHGKEDRHDDNYGPFPSDPIH